KEEKINPSCEYKTANLPTLMPMLSPLWEDPPRARRPKRRDLPSQSEDVKDVKIEIKKHKEPKDFFDQDNKTNYIQMKRGQYFKLCTERISWLFYKKFKENPTQAFLKSTCDQIRDQREVTSLDSTDTYYWKRGMTFKLRLDFLNNKYRIGLKH